MQYLWFLGDDRMEPSLVKKLGKREIGAAIVALILGVVIYMRDWRIIFTHETFYSPEYYQYYWAALLFSLAAGAAIVLLIGASALYVWVPLVLPAFVLRHILFLVQLGPTNTWPPVLAIDFVLTGTILVVCLAARYVRQLLVQKIAGNK